jgi:hypothetical protein
MVGDLLTVFWSITSRDLRRYPSWLGKHVERSSGMPNQNTKLSWYTTAEWRQPSWATHGSTPPNHTSSESITASAVYTPPNHTSSESITASAVYTAVLEKEEHTKEIILLHAELWSHCPLWIPDQRSSGTVVEQAAPRSCQVVTPSGEFRRNRRHLNTLPAPVGEYSQRTPLWLRTPLCLRTPGYPENQATQEESLSAFANPQNLSTMWPIRTFMVIQRVVTVLLKDHEESCHVIMNPERYAAVLQASSMQ